MYVAPRLFTHSREYSKLPQTSRQHLILTHSKILLSQPIIQVVDPRNRRLPGPQRTSLPISAVWSGDSTSALLVHMKPLHPSVTTRVLTLEQQISSQGQIELTGKTLNMPVPCLFFPGLPTSELSQSSHSRFYSTSLH
jgi:hypothetical protein